MLLKKLNCKFVTSRERSLGQGDDFTGVCHSWLPSMHHRSHDQGGSASRGFLSIGGRGVEPRKTHGILQDMVNKREGGGTHPTGMPSCFTSVHTFQLRYLTNFKLLIKKRLDEEATIIHKGDRQSCGGPMVPTHLGKRMHKSEEILVRTQGNH